MPPVLQAAQNGEVSTHEVIENLSRLFNLSESEKEQLLPSGKQRKFDNRVNWAKTYLKQAGLVRYTKRGFFAISDDGQSVLASSPERIDNKYLSRFPLFMEFKKRKRSSASEAPESIQNMDASLDTTPDENLRLAHEQINIALASDLLERVRLAPPVFFEELIVTLLIAMGYGGQSENVGRSLGRSGDDGVDGVIDQDPLGVDQVYVQAKRYAEGNNIGSGAIRDFFGALNLKNAHKGIFFTTSAFTPAATQTAQDLSIRIVLIDGKKLAELMIRYSVGCRDEEILHLKKIDEVFFD